MTTTKTIFDLPRELLNGIISRVPLKSMRAKLGLLFWRYLVNTTSMVEESRMMIMLKNYTLYFISVTVNENPSIDSLGKLTCLNNNSKQIKISRVFYCEGLLFCILKEDDTKVLVWNPYWGQIRWIKQRYSHWEQNSYTYALGYANTNNRRSYKILSFLWYGLYDFDTDSWKKLDVKVTPQWKISFGQSGGVSHKGNTYWCARKSEDKLDDHIICFDFTSERFGPLMCLPFSVALNDNVTLSCVREEKLAVLLTHNNETNLELWITTKIESGKLTWSKFLTLNTEPHHHPISSRFFFIEEENKLAIGSCGSSHCTLSIVGEAGYLRELDLGENYYGSKFVCSYVPSLVQIKQGKGEKRKRENKFRFTNPYSYYSLYDFF